jgi:hypothetical protein
VVQGDRSGLAKATFLGEIEESIYVRLKKAMVVSAVLIRKQKIIVMNRTGLAQPVLPVLALFPEHE